MGDGLTDMAREQKEYADWDAPRCWVCLQKCEDRKLKEHVEKEHSVRDLVDFIVKLGLDKWTSGRKK